MADNIGRWVHRARLDNPGKPLTHAHLVESEVADRFVMRCGREMRARTDSLWMFDQDYALRCYQCNRRPGIVVV